MNKNIAIAVLSALLILSLILAYIKDAKVDQQMQLMIDDVQRVQEEAQRTQELAEINAITARDQAAAAQQAVAEAQLQLQKCQESCN